MPATVIVRRQSSSMRWVFFIFVALVIGALGTVSTLWAMGEIQLPFLRKATLAVAAPSHDGMIPVPLSAVTIPAYTKVTREHLFDPKTGKQTVLYLEPDQVDADMLVPLSSIIGRVLSHTKPAASAFTDRDFLPAGTRSGIVAGIPSGKMAVTLDAERIRGVHSLKAGDHMDLLAAIPSDDRSARSSGSKLVVAPDVTENPKRATVRVLVHDGVIVAPVTARQIPRPTGSASTTPSSGSQSKAIQEVVVAVDPAESTAITEALSMKVEIMCVARSGRPDGGAPVITTPDEPGPKVKAVETITGSKRDTVTFKEPRAN